tara:strand:+ start:159 stop:3725 length:3567 start_codon:yes stop_codon:yes gene_type:complete
MATYLQGVTDFIPQYQPYTPDLNFFDQALKTKQNQYDSNWKQLNKIYGQYYYADLTRDGNIKKKDELVKNIDFNLRRISGMDLSLQSNVDQAVQVFTPFYEDNALMKDMAWTKNWNSENGRAESLRTAYNPEKRKEYWNTGQKYLQYKREEFKNASDDAAMSMGSPVYTPYLNVQDEARKIAKEAGLSMETFKFSKDGRFIITTKNGQQLQRPLSMLFENSLGNDPRVQEIYKTQSYVNRKDYAKGNAAEFDGDEAAAEMKYLENNYNVLKRNQQKYYNSLVTTENEYDKAIADLQQKVKANKASPKEVIKLQDLEYNRKVNNDAKTRIEKEYEDFKNGSSTATTTSGFQNPYADINTLRFKVDAGVASSLMRKDLGEAAQIHSMKGMRQTIKQNPYEVLRQRHANSMAQISARGKIQRDNIKYNNDRKQALAEQKFLTSIGAIEPVVKKYKVIRGKDGQPVKLFEGQSYEGIDYKGIPVQEQVGIQGYVPTENNVRTKKGAKGTTIADESGRAKIESKKEFIKQTELIPMYKQMNQLLTNKLPALSANNKMSQEKYKELTEGAKISKLLEQNTDASYEQLARIYNNVNKWNSKNDQILTDGSQFPDLFNSGKAIQLNTAEQVRNDVHDYYAKFNDSAGIRSLFTGLNNEAQEALKIGNRALFESAMRNQGGIDKLGSTAGQDFSQGSLAIGADGKVYVETSQAVREAGMGSGLVSLWKKGMREFNKLSDADSDWQIKDEAFGFDVDLLGVGKRMADGRYMEDAVDAFDYYQQRYRKLNEANNGEGGVMPIFKNMGQFSDPNNLYSEGMSVIDVRGSGYGEGGRAWDNFKTGDWTKFDNATWRFSINGEDAKSYKDFSPSQKFSDLTKGMAITNAWIDYQEKKKVDFEFGFNPIVESSGLREGVNIQMDPEFIKSITASNKEGTNGIVTQAEAQLLLANGMSISAPNNTFNNDLAIGSKIDPVDYAIRKAGSDGITFAADNGEGTINYKYDDKTKVYSSSAVYNVFDPENLGYETYRYEQTYNEGDFEYDYNQFLLTANQYEENNRTIFNTVLTSDDGKLLHGGKTPREAMNEGNYDDMRFYLNEFKYTDEGRLYWNYDQNVLNPTKVKSYGNEEFQDSGRFARPSQIMMADGNVNDMSNRLRQLERTLPPGAEMYDRAASYQEGGGVGDRIYETDVIANVTYDNLLK